MFLCRQDLRFGDIFRVFSEITYTLSLQCGRNFDKEEAPQLR